MRNISRQKGDILKIYGRYLGIDPLFFVSFK